MLDSILDNIQLTRGDRLFLWALQKASWSAEGEGNKGSEDETAIYCTTLKKMGAFQEEDVRVFIDKMKHFEVFSQAKYRDNVFYASRKELNNIDIYIHDCV